MTSLESQIPLNRCRRISLIEVRAEMRRRTMALLFFIFTVGMFVIIMASTAFAATGELKHKPLPPIAPETLAIYQDIVWEGR